ncbi:MBL fold metallo-hydrolase [Nakamurella sp.]|uniref:MBL fold metallo-hydrolase n=1 Tax=Nakamurella sp. TaxID=1869182 RepID=UPI0037831EB2
MDRVWQWVVDGPAVRVGVTTSRRDRTTSTVVLADRRALIVDPAWDPDELAGIAADLARAAVTVAAGFATHAHHDHVLWHQGLGPGPRFASPRVAQICARDRDEIVRRLGPDWPAGLGRVVGRVQPAQDRLCWDGPETRLITHDAHSPGHTAVWLPSPGVLVAGDMLSDIEIPLLEESTVAQYAAGLESLWPYVDRAAVLIPGHGRVAIGGDAARGRWHADRAYLDALLAGRDPDDPRLADPALRSAHADNVARITPGR